MGTPEVQIQPGGTVFAKSRLSYPNDKDESESATRPAQVKGMPVSGRQWKLDCKRSSSMRVANKLIRKLNYAYIDMSQEHMLTKSLNREKLGRKDERKSTR